MTHHNLDLLDKKILKLLSKDARIPFLEVARACNVSGAAIHQRVAKLTALGILKGSEFIVDPEKIGYETCAYIALYLKNPENYDHAVDALRKIPEVVECHTTTGAADLFIKMYAINNHHLMKIIHDKLQPLGLERSETMISFSASINRQLPIVDLPLECESEEEDEDSDVFDVSGGINSEKE
jgi:Lrp/AsnC family transcriptional regulator for asnA, asnC and gidA